VIDGRAGQELYFGGPDVTSSSRFQLLDKKGDQWVSVDSGSSDLRMGGFAMLALGAGLVAVAAALLPWWNVAYPDGLPSSTTAGVALSFSLGGAAIISGLVMIGASRTTFEFVERDRTIGRARRD
jgi:hypothetical protein